MNGVEAFLIVVGCIFLIVVVGRCKDAQRSRSCSNQKNTGDIPRSRTEGDTPKSNHGLGGRIHAQQSDAATKAKITLRELQSERSSDVKPSLTVCPSCLQTLQNCSCITRSMSYQKHSNETLSDICRGDSPASNRVGSFKKQLQTSARTAETPSHQDSAYRDPSDQRIARVLRSDKASGVEIRVLERVPNFAEHQQKANERELFEKRKEARILRNREEAEKRWMNRQHALALEEHSKYLEEHHQYLEEHHQYLAEQFDKKQSLLQRLERGTLGEAKLLWAIENAHHFGLTETELFDFQLALERTRKK